MLQGNTTFTATSDDGIRVWVDGVLIINAWVDQGPTTYTAVRSITAGTHEVKVEYFENGGGAVAQVELDVDVIRADGHLADTRRRGDRRRAERVSDRDLLRADGPGDAHE